MNHSTQHPNLHELLAHNDQEFVNILYEKLLRRTPDDEGLRYYTNRLRLGYSKIGIVSQLCLSREARAISVSIDGLRFPAFIIRISNIPLIGFTLDLFGFETNTTRQRNIRRLDFTLREINQSLQQLPHRVRHILDGCAAGNDTLAINYTPDANVAAQASYTNSFFITPEPARITQWLTILHKI